jgi:hypothetical protein
MSPRIASRKDFPRREIWWDQDLVKAYVTITFDQTAYQLKLTLTPGAPCPGTIGRIISEVDFSL